MSLTFTKLFSSITESTIWSEPDHVRILWITMLAMADRYGRVWASIPGLANRARLQIPQIEDALDRFQKPDKYSRTPDNEGRRIEVIEGGWRLLNHGKYRKIRDEEAIKESKRNYINNKRAEERKEKEAKALGVTTVDRNVEKVDRSRPNAEADTEADPLTKDSPPTPLKGELDGFPENLRTEAFKEAWAEWKQHRREKKKPLTPTSVKKQLKSLSLVGAERAITIIDYTIQKGWQGLADDATVPLAAGVPIKGARLNGNGTEPIGDRQRILRRAEKADVCRSEGIDLPVLKI